MATYEELFHLIDADHNGELSLSEFSAFCESLPQAPTSSVVQRLFSQADVDGSGFIDVTEFAALCEGVKLLTKLSEREMREAYSTSELRRLFQYATGNASSMRKDEIRKSADVLNEGLRLGHSTDAVARIIRENGAEPFGYEAFANLMQQLAPKHTLSAIVAAFKEEEARRKERLSRVKSVFEMRAKTSSAGLADDRLRPSGTTALAGPCQRCALLEHEQADAQRSEARLRESIAELEHRLARKDESIAVAQVDTERRVRTLELQLTNANADMAERDRSVEQLRTELAAATASANAMSEQLTAVREQLQAATTTISGNDTLRQDNEQLEAELAQLNERLRRCAEETASANTEAARWRRTADEKDAALAALSARMETLTQSHADQSEDTKRYIEEVKRQCAEKDEQSREREAHANALFARAQLLEQETTKREDAVAAREKKLRVLEGKQRAKWEERFVTAAKEMDVREAAARDLEIELSTKTAELQVREQLLDQNVKRAESISLPERERRLRVLQGIEAELCERERRLRQSEQAYVAQLVDPRLVSLREENARLKDLVQELRADREASSNYGRAHGSSAHHAASAAVRMPGQLERGMMSPSFKLL